MNAAEIAAKAASLVSGEREQTHGTKEINFANIAAYWNAFLGATDRGGFIELGPADVAKMMALLKLARMESGDFNPDDAVDACGYAAIAGELSQPTETMR